MPTTHGFFIVLAKNTIYKLDNIQNNAIINYSLILINRKGAIIMSTLKDLNKHLFDQLDRLAKADKSELDAEVKRAQTISQVSENIIDAHRTQLEAVKLIAQYKGLNTNQEVPKIALGDMDMEV